MQSLKSFRTEQTKKHPKSQKFKVWRWMTQPRFLMMSSTRMIISAAFHKLVDLFSYFGRQDPSESWLLNKNWHQFVHISCCLILNCWVLQFHRFNSPLQRSSKKHTNKNSPLDLCCWTQLWHLATEGLHDAQPQQSSDKNIRTLVTGIVEDFQDRKVTTVDNINTHRITKWKVLHSDHSMAIKQYFGVCFKASIVW